MPTERLPYSVRRESVLKIARRNPDGFRVEDVESEVEIAKSQAYKVLRRLVQEGVITRRRGRGKGAAHVYALSSRQPQLDLDETEEQKKKREYNRNYYRQHRSAARREKGRSDRSNRLQESARLAEAAKILFPNGLKVSEEFFAWVDWTRELMNG